MISPTYCQQMARYNRWQNTSLYREAAGLTQDQRRADRGAFFGSVQRTLCHILTADHIWMSRFDNWDMPKARGDKSPDWITDWNELTQARNSTDQRLIQWADALDDGALSGEVSWQSGIKTADVSAPLWSLVTHLFNHQTHHRGQVHALLTGYGCTPDATDFGFMPLTLEN